MKLNACFNFNDLTQVVLNQVLGLVVLVALIGRVGKHVSVHGNHLTRPSKIRVSEFLAPLNCIRKYGSVGPFFVEVIK